MNVRKLTIVAVALTASLGAGLAEARDRADVQWSISIGAPGVLVGPAVPYYAAPQVRYVTPAPVYVEHYRDRPAAWRGGPRRWDRDGDGIPNRHDRVYNPRWDRDGDGIPNRYDRVYNTRWDRDGDGIPNRYDRRPNRPN